VITGHAVLTGARTVEISAGEDRLTVRAESIVIGNRSGPAPPHVTGLLDSSRLTASTTGAGRAGCVAAERVHDPTTVDRRHRGG
jgi:hypothetical protein